MSPTATTSLKRSRSSTPSLGTPPRTPGEIAGKGASAKSELTTGEPHIKQELERWENIVFSFGMDDNHRQSNDQEYPGDYQSTPPPPHLHQLSEGHIHSTTGANASGLPASWDMSSFFPPTAYGQHSPYDMLGLGAMNPIAPAHPHAGSPVPPSPFGNPWDLSLYTGMEQPHAPAQPLTPAEIAQYHALLARGAAAYSVPTSDVPHPPGQTPGASSASAAPSSQAPPARARSVSSAGGSSSRSQVANTSITDEEAATIAEDKRRRNTAASARFRVKKKQRTMELERTLVELEGRADQLQKEAVELRRENGWLKEMVILKGRKAMENAQAAGRSNADAGPSSAGEQDQSKDSADDESEDSAGKGKGRSKD